MFPSRIYCRLCIACFSGCSFALDILSFFNNSYANSIHSNIPDHIFHTYYSHVGVSHEQHVLRQVSDVLKDRPRSRLRVAQPIPVDFEFYYEAVYMKKKEAIDGELLRFVKLHAMDVSVPS